jgi:hypothetical protein
MLTRNEKVREMEMGWEMRSGHKRLVSRSSANMQGSGRKAGKRLEQIDEKS